MEELIKKAILNIPVENSLKDVLRVGLAFNRKGKPEIHFTDSTDMGQDDGFLTNESFPNDGTVLAGRNHLWMSIFKRYAVKVIIAED